MEETLNTNNSKTNNMFKKLKINIYFNIFYYLDFFTLVDVYFINKQFKKLVLKKYQRRIEIILTSIKIYKKHIKISFSEELRNLLQFNSFIIRKEIKPLINNIFPEHFNNLSSLRYYFNNLKNKNLRKINLERCDLAKKSIKYLAFYLENNNIVEKVNLSRNKLHGSVLSPLPETIGTVKNLKILKLNNCLIDIKSLISVNALLVKNKSVEHLSLRSCNIEDNFILVFTESNLKYLDLFDNNISSEGVYHICSKMKKIEILNLGKNNVNTIAAVFLSLFIKEENCLLENLNLEQNYISSVGIKAIITSIGLSKRNFITLNLNYNLYHENNIVSFENLKLENLKIAGNKLNNEMLMQLFDNLRFNKSIQKIDISDSSLNNKLIEFILEVLSLSNINKLTLKNCYFRQSNFLNILLDFFSNDKCNLINLNLSQNNLYSSNCKPLTDILLSNKLVSLNLSSNALNLWEDSFEDFCKCLKINVSLRKLNLSENYLGSKVKFIFENLYLNETLEILILDKNCISQAEDINKQLLMNTSIKKLSLSNNEISDSDLYSFLDYFRNKTAKNALNVLNLNYNKITTKGLIEFIDLFKEKKIDNFQKLKLKSRNFNEYFMKEEDIYLLKNKFDPIVFNLISF